MTDHEREGFNWAVSDFDLAKLHGKYAGASPRAIVRGEVREVLDTYPGKIKHLEKAAAEQAPLRAELKKITAQNVSFRIDKNFFGLKPIVSALVVNGSPHSVSQLQWRASLFLNGADRPTLTTVLTNDYRPNGGLKPSDRYQVQIPIGFVRGDEAWTTLEIRNADHRRLTLEPVLDSILDFGERAYLPEDPASQIEGLKAAIDAAKLYSDI